MRICTQYSSTGEPIATVYQLNRKIEELDEKRHTNELLQGIDRNDTDEKTIPVFFTS